VKTRTWVINGVLIVVLAAAGFGVYEAFSPAQGSAQTQTRTSAVRRATVTETVSAAGTISSAYTANVNFSSAGKVTTVDVGVGDVVHAGQQLATIDHTQASRTLTVAKDNLLVAKENSASGSTSTSGGQTGAQTASSSAAAQAASAASLKAKVDQAQLDVDNAQAAYDATILTAPGDGTVTAVNGAVGQQAGSASSSGSSSASGSTAGSSAGSATGTQSSSDQSGQSSSSATSSGGAFIVLTDMSDLVVNTSVAEIDASKVKAGQQATVTINALPDNPVQATVSKVDLTPTTSGSTVSYGAQLALVSPPEGLRPGQSASVAITVAQADNALSVPAAAVLTTGNTNTVIVSQNGGSTPVQVRVGVRGESTVEITSGLSEGENVVLTGASAPTTSVRGGAGAGAGGLGGAGGVTGTGGQRGGGAGGR
jgi:macrolide-specific efflux system membrane fusion protein